MIAKELYDDLQALLRVAGLVVMSAYEKVVMINNLLVSIVSNKAAQPVLNVDLRSLLPESEEVVRKADSGSGLSAALLSVDD